MLITFGTGFYGKVATVNNQWIETKFFSVMFVPLFPLGSMLVTSSEFRRRRGIDIEMSTTSVIAAYARLFTIIIAAVFIFLAFTASSYSTTLSESMAYGILAFVSTAACLYFFFYYGKANGDDLIIRSKVGSITGVYALPHWLEISFIDRMLKKFEATYTDHYPEHDWKTDLKDNSFESGAEALLYGLALFNCIIYDRPENDELYGIYKLPKLDGGEAVQDFQPAV
jgi:hypothetical protein